MIKLLEMWKLAHLFKYLYLYSLLFFNTVALAQGLDVTQAVATQTVVTQELVEKVLVEDKLALKVGREVYFQSDLKELFQSFSQIKCLDQSLVLDTIDFKQNHNRSKNRRLKQADIKVAAKYLQLRHYIASLKVGRSFPQECRGKYLKNRAIQDLFMVEAYLRSRFILSQGVDRRGLKIFTDTVRHKVFHELFD